MSEDKFFLSHVEFCKVYYKGPGGLYYVPITASEQIRLGGVMPAVEIAPYLRKALPPVEPQSA